MSLSKSIDLFKRAAVHIPGGVNSPVRAFRSVGGDPVFMQKAHGAYLYDADGNSYIDYINSWGPMILGHGRKEVIEAMRSRMDQAISFGAPTETEIEIAELICSMVPGLESVRLVSSGTEACMSAVRLARGYTGRNKIVKFEGCYHGHADEFLVKAGSGLATFDIQTVPGITSGVSQDTLTAEYNSKEAIDSLIGLHGKDIAAIIIEPVAGNMGCILPEPGYLEHLRKVCTANGIVLIFDEVMTGFRLSAGGAQELFNIQADLVCYGKVLGGGMPMAAFGGKKEIMNHIAPMGKVYQAGTLSGNPISVAAGYATLKILNEDRSIYQRLEEKGNLLREKISDVLNSKGIPYTINHLGSMFSVHFAAHKVSDFSSAASTDIEQFKRFFHHMLKQGVYLPPSAFETWFLSDALSEEDISKTAKAIETF